EEVCRQKGGAPDSLVAEWVRRAASSVFAYAPSVVSGARETLTLLRARGTRLGLLTKGDHQVQHHRIEQSGLSDLFDVIQIVHEKTPATIQDVVTSLGVEPGSAWMVGNSVRSDVLPAIKAGLKAVWINAHVWEYERTHDHLVDDRVITATSLTELSGLIPQ
ncbi:MAG TPA: HAD hydrolase-like protein, partial [Thermoanaerobaculia bacterium]|nr:HAD hydrolase-like protein [Thermoanaerobaculia bacterium]